LLVKQAFRPNLSAPGFSSSDAKVTLPGFETPDATTLLVNTLRKSPSGHDAESDAVADNSAEPTPIDQDLARVIDAWANLPEPIRAAVMAMIGTVK